MKIDAVYTTPMEHHNPMEPHATIASWDGDQLLLYDATQYVSGVRSTVAKTLGIPLDKVRVVDPFVGGGFGCRARRGRTSCWPRWRRAMVERPVKLVLARPQMFGPVGGRPQTEQHIVLGARRDGTLTAVRHDVVSHTSTLEDFTEPSSAPTRILYACANATTSHRVASLNVGVPTFQRAPGLATGTFALEVAMDELAYALERDPLELRLRNYATLEPHSGKEFSSKYLREFVTATRRRDSAGRGATRSRARCRAAAISSAGDWRPRRIRRTRNRRRQLQRSCRMDRLVQSGTQDLGTGTYTTMTQIAAEALGVPVEKVRFEIGDTSLPPAPVSGGSMTSASVGTPVLTACNTLREKVSRKSFATRNRRCTDSRRCRSHWRTAS